jgi:hypothetical protein
MAQRPKIDLKNFETARRLLRVTVREADRIHPECASPSVLLTFRQTMHRMLDVVEGLSEAVLQYERFLDEIEPRIDKAPPPDPNELALVPLDQLDASAKDGRSYTRRCTEALASGRQSEDRPD